MVFSEVCYLLHGITSQKTELYILYFCFSVGYYVWIVNTRNKALSNRNKKVKKKKDEFVEVKFSSDTL
jgi:hypothetical protein